jgi:hypothetical protein
MTSAEESKYIILPAAAVVIITSLMFGIGNTASKAVDQSSPQQSVSTAAVITPVSSVQQPVREEPKKVVETPVQIAEPASCGTYRKEIRDNLIRIAYTDAGSAGDNSAPRAAVRAQEINGYNTRIQTTINLMAAQQCKLPEKTPDAGIFYLSALDCRLAEMQGSKCDIWKDIKER